MKSNTIQFRILSEAVDKIYPTPRFQYGDFVAYRSSKKGWIIGEVTKLVWHEKDQEFKYYLSINEKEEKRWLDPDRIEPFNLNEFSKTISHALRHVPEEYHLTLLDGDWVLHSDLIDELSKKKPEWENINLSVIKVMIDRSEKKRHEIDGEFISAKYGHTAHVELSLPNSSPPEILYHGTSRKSAKIILKEGLKSMDRHYVHSS
ncbi:RNA 2'-phosphotransferase, partial [Crocinitomicaceae bacterium]|nr:RNA 2'-phosphotransferase [Crocinitomicaceae bacterium]